LRWDFALFSRKNDDPRRSNRIREEEQRKEADQA